MGYELWISPNTGYRRRGTRFSALKKIFIDNVTVREIYEPLMCCRINDPAIHVKQTLQHRQFDTAGVIEQEQKIFKYVVADELNEGTISDYCHEIKLDQVISDSTPLANLLLIPKNNDFVYINHATKVIGIITKADLNKPPVRVYVFGMISLFEMHLNSWIRHEYPENSWHTKISENRLSKAREIHLQRLQKNQDLSLLDCLQFADKGVLLAKSAVFLERFEYKKKFFEHFVKQVESIRNQIAHSQDSIISTLTWDDFVDVLEKVDKFLSVSDEQIEAAAIQGANNFVEYLLPTA